MLEPVFSPKLTLCDQQALILVLKVSDLSGSMIFNIHGDSYIILILNKLSFTHTVLGGVGFVCLLLFLLSRKG